MKLTLKWLKDYVDVKLPPKDLADLLTMSGVHVTSFERKGNDHVFEFEITSNRSDCLSVIGIAREVAAITGGKLKTPKDLANRAITHKKQGKSVKIRVDDQDLCQRYTGRVIRDVKVGESSKDMRDKLTSIGLRPVNNVVDTTNFLLMETGQPMHAFDLDKIKGEVIIRKAKKGETIKTIEGSLLTLSQGMLIIADADRPIAIAGIMGGLDTEVTRDTKNILLESAYFDPISVRRTSRILGLSSESSYRFERKADNQMVLPASIRAAYMIKKVAGGSIEELIDIGKKGTPSSIFLFDPQKSNEILGVGIPTARQKKILESLNFAVKKKKGRFEVTIPARRRDITQEVDITEEIARIFGYNNIPQTLPQIIGNTQLIDREGIVKEKVRTFLLSMGLKEIITYNLVPAGLLDLFEIDKDKKAYLANPLSQEQGVLTQTLLLGMLRVISRNINRKNSDLSLYEIGKVYRCSNKDKFDEELRLSIGVTGLASQDWVSGRRKITFFDLKGIVEALLEKLGIKNVKFSSTSNISYFSSAAMIECGGEEIGVVGKMKEKISEEFDINEDVFTAEISLEKIVEKALLEKRFKAIPKFPSIIRDISMLTDRDISAESIVRCVRDSDSKLIKGISLVDIYKGKQIPQGKSGLLYRIEYRDDSRTLTDAEVEEVHNRIKHNLTSSLKISFR